MSTAEQANDWIAERVLDFHPTGEEIVRKAIVRLARPMYHPPEGEKHGYWTASFEIEIENGRTIARHSHGEDGIQALQLAMAEIDLHREHQAAH
ncbi:hypothetical protein [Polyangium sp. y55x31]|uniref:DUF6968 family protein n=1 Tax=Polyangium sp. y55x31 TaxID=3042688 RepID=UPI0024832050|nr:hypothetical protein [Polyangium sp. y55x31]MDI1479206.1 hypothetical protein [Polyangium sp. y55x31]